MRIKNFTKAASLALALCIFCTACTPDKPQTSAQLMPDNDVPTMTPIADGKTVITVSYEDNMDIPTFKKAIEEKFENIQIIAHANVLNEMEMERGAQYDLYFTMNPYFFDRNGVENVLIDLSAKPFVNNYYLSALNSSEIDGKIYYLPGPSSLTGIVYNKRMFRENGWEVPTGLTEFIELCAEIEKTGIRAFQPTLYHKVNVNITLGGFGYSQMYSGIDNYIWLQDYNDGKASLSGHIDAALENFDRLVQNNVIRAEDFDMRPIVRSTMMYDSQTCAMITETQLAPQYAQTISTGEPCELGMMPFYSSDEPDSDYVFSQYIYYISTNKKLEQKGNEVELAAVMDILEYISTPEGQAAIVGADVSLKSPIIGVDKYADDDFLADIDKTVQEGRAVALPRYNSRFEDDFLGELRLKLLDYVKGTATAQELAASCDALRDERLNSEGDEDVVHTLNVEKNFTVMQTAQFMAQMFADETGAEIAFCRANTRRSGCFVHFYEGELSLSAPDAAVLKNFCYNIRNGFMSAELSPEQNTLMLVKMTGENIKRALGETYLAHDVYLEPYLTSVGLDVEYAPWAGEGNRVQSIALRGGERLEDDGVYTVAMWGGSVAPELITEVVQTYPGDFYSLLVEYLSSRDSISPIEDSGFKLNWTVR